MDRQKILKTIREKAREMLETEALLQPSPFGGYIIGVYGGEYQSTRETLNKKMSLEAEIDTLAKVIEITDEEEEELKIYITGSDWWNAIREKKEKAAIKTAEILPEVMEATNYIMGSSGRQVFSDEQVAQANRAKKEVLESEAV